MRSFSRFPAIFSSFVLLVHPAVLGAWELVDESNVSNPAAHPGLSYVKRTHRRASDGKVATVHLAFFNSRDYRFEVIDLGDGQSARYPGMRQAFLAHDCVAGVNGGFFHPGYRPIGLVIAGGKRLNQFQHAKLISGVVYADDRGLHIVRRSAFQAHAGITALLQTGPYLIEHGRSVRGLSADNPRRRSFVATDWRRNWAIGSTSNLALRDLADLLDSSGSTLTGWPVDRAINLDGGSSSAFFFDRPEPKSDITVVNWKRIRTLLGVTPTP